MVKLSYLLVASFFLACSPVAVLAGSPFDVTPTRYPFLPSLVQINEPSVCSPFLATVTKTFKEPDFDIASVGHALPGVKARWLLSAEDIAAQFDGANNRPLLHDIVPLEQITPTWDYLTATEIDFAGDGSANMLAVLGSEDDALRRYYSVVLFKNKAALEEVLADARSLDGIEERAVASWHLDRPSILEMGGSFYAVTNPQSSGLNDVHEELWHLALGGAELACSVQLAPPQDARSPEVRLAGPTIQKLDRILDAMTGQEASCSGTLHALSRSNIYANQVLRRIELRPWALGEVDPYNDLAEIDSALYQWGRRGIWNFRMLRELERSTTPAQDFLRPYYRDGFGIPEETAGRLAEAAFDLLIRSRFVFPRRPQPVDMEDPAYKLRGALLAGSSEPAAIEALLAAGAAISNDYAGSSWEQFSTEPTLFYALESPAYVELLLNHGADVNARGNFGKTALMYAAQFNLLETATLLLERGTDVNATTKGAYDCWSAVDVSGRTALMYAAENADLAMVELLLRHGANAGAIDSIKRSADTYVDRNEHVTRETATEIYRRLRDAKSLQ